MKQSKNICPNISKHHKNRSFNLKSSQYEQVWNLNRTHCLAFWSLMVMWTSALLMSYSYSYHYFTAKMVERCEKQKVNVQQAQKWENKRTFQKRVCQVAWDRIPFKTLWHLHQQSRTDIPLQTVCCHSNKAISSVDFLQGVHIWFASSPPSLRKPVHHTSSHLSPLIGFLPLMPSFMLLTFTDGWPMNNNADGGRKDHL